MTLYDLPQFIVLPYLFVMGAVVGSMLNVCIYRIPRHERLRDQLRGLISPPSSCPNCKRRIPWFDNIPIIGWLKLGGRCRFCRMRFSARYPCIELFNGLLFALLYWYEIPSGWGTSIADSPIGAPFGVDPATLSRSSAIFLLHARFVYHLVLIESLIVATFIDFDLKIIPDASTLPAMAVGVIAAAGLGRLYLVPLWWQDTSVMFSIRSLLPEQWDFLFPATRYPAWIAHWPHLHGLLVSVTGLIVGGGVVWAVRLIGRWVLREEAMGFGDVILMAMIGSFLGWQPTLVVFFIAPLCALAVVAAAWLFRRQREIPYGPYLSLATLIVLFGWKRIWPAAERIFDLGPLLPVFAVLSAVMLALALMFVQLVKRLLGIRIAHEHWVEEWTTADQLMQFAGNKIDNLSSHRASSSNQWLGTAAGRGTLYDHRWRNGRSRG